MLNIMVHGVLEPVLVRVDGEVKGKKIVEVVDGRQRVRAAREANRRLRREGKEPVQVSAIRKRGDDGELFGIMASSFIRQDESPVEQAKKMQRYVAYGKTEEGVAIIFGVSRSTVRQRLALLDAAPEVKRAVEAGKLSSVAAARLTKLPREQQAAELPELLNGEGSQKERVTGIVPKVHDRMIGRKKLAKLLEIVDCSPHPPRAADVLRFILGEADALESKWTEGL